MGTYDDVTESWVLTPPGSSSGEPFRIWTIGNVSGPGSKGTIENVRLSISYDVNTAPAPTFTLTPSTTGGFGGISDPSLATAATLIQTVTDGSSPLLTGGSPLPAHGIFGPETAWQEFALGDFSLSDSDIGDFIGGFPTDLVANGGQINAYEISVLNASGTSIHFDLYDSVGAKNHAKFAPFSHDADGTANIVPEPASFAIWSMLSLFGFVAHRRRRKLTA